MTHTLNTTAHNIGEFNSMKGLNYYEIHENNQQCYARGEKIVIIATSEEEAITKWNTRREG